MTNYPHLAARLYGVPLLLTMEKAEIIERVFRMRVDGDTRAEVTPAPRRESLAQGVVHTDAGYYRTAEGVALIQVIGTLVQRAGAMDAASGLVGYNRMAMQIDAAVADPRADAILLEIDSNGGEVPGVMDLAAKINAARNRKPVWSIANEGAFSAAYWVASATERVSAPVTGLAGSIGVVMMHVDQSGLDAKRGLTYTPIFAGARKVDFNPHVPLSDATRATAQAEVDRIYELFVAAVAGNRNMSADAVKATEAGIFPAQTARDLGLIDAVESFDATLTAITAEAKRFRVYGPRARAQLSTERTDMDMKDKPAAGAATAEVTEAQARGFTEGRTEGQRSGAETERTRVAGILTHAEADGRRALAEHLAFKTTNSVEDAAALLAAAPKAAPPTDQLKNAMANVPNPKVGMDGGVDGDAAKPSAPIAANVYAFRRECVAKARSR